MGKKTQKIENFWQDFLTDKRKKTFDSTIKQENIDIFNDMPLEPDKTYINITINEMWLSRSSDFWDKVEPMVFAATELLYLNRDKGRAELQSIPSIIGPDLLADLNNSSLPNPDGISIQNTRVLGPTPYIGGPITWTLILYQVPSGNSVQAMLNLLETITGMLTTLPGLTTLVSVSQAILTGFNSLLETRKPVPIIGKRIVFQDSYPIRPGYYVIINAPEDEINLHTLWVKNGRLYVGKTLENSIPFTEKDFILFSISALQERDDDKSLDFYPYFRKALELISTNLTQAALSMQTLVQEVRNSPDLTNQDRKRIIEKYITEYKDAVFDYRAVLMEIEPTIEWKHQQEEDAINIGYRVLSTSKGLDDYLDVEYVLVGLDPRFS